MKVPWPQPFEDGDVGSFLEDFEDVADVAGIKSDRGKLVALRALLKGRAKAVLDAARRGPEKLDWAAAKEALLDGFSTAADRQESMRRFREAQFGVGTDPLIFAVSLRSTLSRGLPEADEATTELLLVDKFLSSLPIAVRSQLNVARIARPMSLEELATASRQLISENETVANLQVTQEENRWQQMQNTIDELTTEVSALRMKNMVKRRNGLCFRCGKPGHWWRQCPQNRLNNLSNKRFNNCLLHGQTRAVIGAIDIKALQAEFEIDGTREICLVDTGAAISLTQKRPVGELNQCDTIVRTVGGFTLKIDGTTMRNVKIGGSVIKQTFLISPESKQTILGMDFLKQIGAVINLKDGKIATRFGSVKLTTNNHSEIGELNIQDRVSVISCTNRRLSEAIEPYQELFTGDHDQYGYCDWVEHEIPLEKKSFKPFAQRRLPVNLEPEIRQQVTIMLREDIIEETRSKYNSPILMVKKPNGKFRFCVDFRRLNDITINQVTNVPAVTEIFDRLQNARFFTVFDLRSGYWQVPIKKEDRPKTAFTVGDKQYCFKRMPFGLSGAPSTFRRLMLKVLDGLPNTAVYGDDIIIYSTNEVEHAAAVVAVLQRIKEAGLRINGSKAQIAKQSVTLLGHKVGQGKIEPLPEKLLSLESCPIPKSKRELRRFLGRAGFYSRFIRNFNMIASPLYELLKKESAFHWPESANQAFRKIQQLVTGEQLTLKLPSFDQAFCVSTDASDNAIGAVLKQSQGVVEYASRILTPAERNYSTTEKECLAIVWALDKWRPYLLGRRFHVETDHKPLQWIKVAKDPRGKLARWALRLQEYDFTIQHVPGNENHLPDILSRAHEVDEFPAIAYGVNAFEMESDITALHRAQRADTAISQIIDTSLAGKDPPE